MPSQARGKRIIALISERGGGDAPPVVALASALHARGHDISVLCDAGTETAVRAAGLVPIMIPDELEQGRHVDPRWLMQLHERGEALTAATPNPLTAWAQRCAPMIGSTLHQLQPALLLSSLFCTALTNILAKEIGIPWCFVNPSFYFGDYGEQTWEDDFVGLGAGWFRYILLPHCDQANLVLHATDPQFDPPPTGLPNHHHYIGPLFWEPTLKESASPPEEPGLPWALISLSTAPQDDEITIARAAFQALANKPVRTLLTLAPNHPRDELGPIPRNALVSEFVPHGMVLNNASLIVSHAGHGIVMKGLYHGVSMVLVPWARDQFGVARRAEELGVAVVVRREECSYERMTAAVDQVFGDERFSRNALAISQRLQNENPEDRACLHIEDFLRRQS